MYLRFQVRTTLDTVILVNTLTTTAEELWRIVDYLYRNGGLSTPELFTSCGNNDDVPNIFDDLDTNTAFRKQYAPISMAEVLVRFLDSLSK